MSTADRRRDGQPPRARSGDLRAARRARAGERTYTETNCYTRHPDRADPRARRRAAGRRRLHRARWTSRATSGRFFKPPPEDLEALFGIDIHEMQPYRPLPRQIAEQIEAGRTLIVELDSWYLPDTAATSYRTRARQDLGGRRGDRPAPPSASATSTTRACTSSRARTTGARSASAGRSPTTSSRPTRSSSASTAARACRASELRAAAASACCATISQRRPATNPFERFGAQLDARPAGAARRRCAQYHDYAFATVRMFGSAFEITASHVDWLLGARGRADGGGAGRDRRRLEGALAASSRAASRSTRAAWSSELGRAWDGR